MTQSTPQSAILRFLASQIESSLNKSYPASTHHVSLPVDIVDRGTILTVGLERQVGWRSPLPSPQGSRSSVRRGTDSDGGRHQPFLVVLLAGLDHRVLGEVALHSMTRKEHDEQDGEQNLKRAFAESYERRHVL